MVTKKTSAIVLTVVLLTVLIAGCLGEKSPPAESDVQDNNTEANPDSVVKPEYSDYDLGKYNQAVDSENGIYCGMIEDQELKDKCHTEFPESQVVGDNDVEFSNPPEFQTAYDQEKYEQAVESENGIYCGMIVDETLKAKCKEEFPEATLPGAGE